MNARDTVEPQTEGPVGLDRRRRPSTRRGRLLRGLRQSAPFSTLQRRIIFFNLIGLAILAAGILYFNQFRSGLIDQRIRSLHTQGELIAITIAESAAAGEDLIGYDPARANTVLARLVPPTGVRAQIYDAQLRLTGDTRRMPAGTTPISVRPLPPPEGQELTFLQRLQRSLSELWPASREGPPIYSEVPQAGISNDREVVEAARGQYASALRVNSEGDLIVSVALPIRRYKAVQGILVLSTVGDDINQIVRKERVTILQVFFMAAAVSVLLSIVLANTIARPIQSLARAVDPEGTGGSRAINPDRIEVPDLTGRTDEIGDLSASLIRMTDALYTRIEAIESFAADVAHEIKNPLTSLRSAVETMSLAKTPEQRQRLLDVIQQDVGRLDRLVTDISNASRLDAELVRERMESFDLGKLIETIVDMLSSQAEQRGVRIVTKTGEDVLRVRGLEGRIAQVVTNLVDNALSFSPAEGTVTVEARRREDGGVRVTVSDEGPGIPPDNLRSVFERFYSERPEEGFGDHSGLGLSICKQIIDAHDAEIWAENILPPGSFADADPLGARFVFELPE